MRRVLSGLALLATIWIIPASFADKAPPPPPPTNPTPIPKPPEAPRPEPVTAKNCELTLEEFMDNKIKTTIKDSTLTKEQVDVRLASYFKELATMAPDPKWNEGTSSWKKLAEKTIDKKTWGTSCKTCHKAFETKYNKTHHDKKICFTPIP